MKISDLFTEYLRRNYHALLARKKRKYLDNLIENGLSIGKNVEIIENFFFDPSHCFLISIGNDCTICPNVRLIAHDASTKKILGYTKIGKINIRERCFIGDSVIVLPKVTIGPDAIIGAGSVVTRDIPPNSVAAGNPAKVICSLDDYLKKISTMSKRKKIFNEAYFIENIDEAGKREILASLKNGLGFIN
jgi:maltose O-acetyltransferase